MSERFEVVTNLNEFTIYDSYKRIYITDMMELVKEANLLHESRMRFKKIKEEQENEIQLWSDSIHGLLAIQELRQRAKIFDTWER